ncbi:MFS transporter [Oscillospiraceae bacterium HV4-5-C5C]|nr:MFS transporter [Oscillospiraceae bacterium HV4-5-C5C]
MSQQSSKLRTRPTRPFNYAVGMFGTSIPINMFKTYAFIFYVDKLSAISSQSFALILSIYTVIDIIDNPIYGYLSDRTRSPWGRRRPWLVLGAPLLALSLILFFSVPATLAPGSVFSYALLMYILTGTLDSLINTNYGALFPELFKTEAERARTNALRQVFQLLAMILSMALTPLIAGKIGYQTTAIIYGILAVAVILFMTFTCPETAEAQARPKPQLWRTIRDIVRNPKFWLYGLTNAAFFAAFAVLQQSVSFYAKYVLNNEDSASTILLLVVILVAIASIPLLWVRLIRRTHLMKAWRLALATVALAIILLSLSRSLVISALIMLLLGTGYGGVTVTMDLVAARILDEDRARHGIQREGMFSSLLGVLNKSSTLITALAFLLVSQLFGYVSGDQPGPQPVTAARFLISYFPFAIMLICVVLSYFVHFDEENPAPQAPTAAAGSDHPEEA